MTTYATMNPLGSTAVKDLYDNAQNLDVAVNGETLGWLDRSGKPRKTFAGIEADARTSLEQTGYVYTTPLTYVAGIVITLPNQIFNKDGEYYKIAPGVALPYTTTGVWATEQVNFRSVGDATLRTALAQPNGVDLVGGATKTVSSIAAARLLTVSGSKWVTVDDYYGDGTCRMLSFYRVDPTDNATPDDGVLTLAMVGGGRLKLNHSGFITLKQAGCKGDGVTDDTVRIQAAVNCGIPAIYVNPVAIGYRTTAPIVIPRSLTIRGEGVMPFAEGGPYNSKGYGSWFFLDHPGRGFTAETSVSAGFIATVYYDKIGTYRNHTNPVAPGWTPTVFDFDFSAKNTDVFYTNLMLLNPYRGIFHTNGNGGRVTIDQVRGQFLSQAVYIETTQDSTRIENLHDWPFWIADANVTGWQTANKNCISLGRCDNPLLSNIFSIYTSNGIYMFNYAGDAFNSGSVSKLKAVNVDFDQTWNWLTIETGANDITAQFSNTSVFGPAPSAFSHGALIKGNYARLDFVNYHAEAVSNEAMYIQGTGNIVKILNARAKNYARINSATPAFFCDTGNVLEIGNRLQTEGIGSVLLGGGGNITYPQGSTRGTVSLGVGATTVLVTHNLPLMPSTEQIQLTLGGPIGAAKALYVTAVTATTFTVTSEVAASIAVVIHWRAALE